MKLINKGILVLAALFIFAMNEYAQEPVYTSSYTNQLCTSVNDGSITVTFTSAGPNFIELILGSTIIDSITTNNLVVTFSNLAPAVNYMLTVKGNPHDEVDMITISNATPLVPGTISGNQSICSGVTPAVQTGNAASGQSGNFSYQWYGNSSSIFGANGISYSPPALTVTTIYSRQVIDLTCSENAFSNNDTITVSYAPTSGGTIAYSGTVPICYNTAPSAFTSSVNASGGTSPQYQWQYSTSATPVIGDASWVNIPGATSSTYTPASNLTSSTWYIRKYFNGCGTVYSNMFDVTVYNPTVAGTISNSVIGFCWTAGSVSVPAFTYTAPTGGSGVWTYQWQESTTGTGVWTNLSTTIGYTPGTITKTYYYRRIETNTCSKDTTNTFEIREVNLSTTPGDSVIQQPTCAYSTNGSLMARAGGSDNGFLPYTYNWSNGANTATITNLSVGAYQATITDNLGCSIIRPWPLSSISGAITIGSATPSSSCPSPQANGSITISGVAQGTTVESPYTYSVYNTGTSTTTKPYTSGSATLPSGTYDVWVTDKLGCTNNPATPVVVTIGTNPAPVATASSNTPVCAGNPLTLAGGPAGMTSYSWSGPNAYVSALQNPTVSANATAAMAGTYTLTVTNASGCTSTATAIVVVNALPVATASNNGPVCVGNPLILTGGPAGMTSYSWSGPNAYVSALQSPTVSANATAAMAGTYTLTVTNANGCINTATTTVTVNALPVATASSNTPVCTGNPLTLAGGPAGMTSYSWSGPNAYVSALQNPTVSAIATAAMAGTYTLTVTNASGCTSTATATVVINTSPVATASSNTPVCAGNPLTLAGGPAGMTSYSWSGPNAYVSALQNPTVSANATAAMAGTYTLTVTNASGCMSTATAIVVVNVLPVATASNNGPVCVGNPLTLAGGPAGMTSYSWSGPNAYVSALQSPTVSAHATAAMAGTYTLTVTNANGCINTATTTVTVNALPVATASSNTPVCTGNPLTLAGGPAGMTSYSWSGPNAYVSALQNPTVSANATAAMTGTYTLTVTNASGCTSTATATVVINTSPVAMASSNTPVCAGNPLTLAGGPAGMTSYSWSGPNAYVSALQNPTVSANATAAMAGTYTLTVTNASGCTSTATAIVVVNALPVATASNNGPVCVGNPLTLAGGPAGMTSYSWSGPNAYVSALQSPTVSANATAAMAGTYTLTVTNASGCINTATTTVTVNALPVATASSNTPVCAGNPLTLAGGPAGMTSYSWSGPNAYVSALQNPTVSANATAAMAGTYTLTVTNASGCTSTATAIVVVNALPVATASNNGPVCVGNPLTLAGGPAGMTSYSWSGPNAYVSALQSPTVSAHATVAMAGTYTLTVTNANGCINTATTTVTVNALPVATASSNTPVCAGNPLTLAGGPAGMTSYSWSGPNAYVSALQNPTVSANATAAMAGTYTLTVTNASGCTSTATAIVVINALPVATASSNTPVCAGNPLTLAGGPAGMTSYSWSGPNAYVSALQNPTVSANATAAMAGTYTLTVTNASGCTSTATAIVVVNALPVATASNNGPVCVGNPLTLAGGPAGMTSYSWSGPNAYVSALQNPTVSAHATAAMAGTYTLTVTNANGCINTATTTVTVNALPVATASSNTPVCAGNPLTLAGGPAGMTSYSWSGPNAYVSALQNPTVSANATAAMAGTYTLTVTNASGCTSTATAIVVINALPVATASSNTPVCAGNPLTLAGGPAGMTSYSWSGPNAYVSALQNPTVSANATAAMAGTYTLTVTNASGCTSTATAIVVVNALPVATASNNGPVCVGNPLTLAGGPAGMTSYSWSGPNAYVSALQNPTVSANATAAMAGTYTLTVTNANGCINTATTTVTVNALPVATASSNTPVCAGNPLTLAGGPAGMKSYSWSGPNAYVSALQNPTVSANATAAMAGTYTLTVTNASGCTSTATATVVINTSPVATASSNTPVCAGNPLTLAGGPAGMTSYSWSGPNAYVSALQNPTVSANATAAMAGTYTLTVTNASGCTSTATAIVVVNALPVATASNNGPVCVGNPLTLAGGPAGMTSYSWSGPNAYVSALQSPTVSANATAAMAGTYTLTVTNASGCINTATTTVTVNALPVATASSNTPVCAGNPLTLAGGPAGMTSYSWSGPNAYVSALQNPTVSANATAAMAGTYTLTVTNASGCTSTATAIVVVNALPVATASNNGPVCVGNPLTLAGGPAGMTSYSWSGPNAYVSALQNPTVSANATAAMAGTYTLTVTNANGCINTATTTVTVNALPVATASSNTPVCAGNPLTLAGGPAGMKSYSWSGPNAYVSALQNPTVSANATAAMAGTYTLTVTNASGCTSTATAIVVINALPVATASSNTPVCAGNPLTLAGGPAGMTSYSWSGPNAYVSALQNPTVSANATAAMAGTYTLTVTNASGCTSTATAIVVVNALPVATASNNGPVCVGNPLTLAGGPAGMTSYSWSGPNAYVSALQNPTVSANATAAMAGTYTLTVTNANGCINTATTTVTVNALPVATASSNTPVCAGNPLTLAGGPAGMKSYSWSGPNAYVSALQNPTVSANATAAMAGTYTLTVTNASGCTSTATAIVVINALPVATASSNTPVCAGNPLTLAGGPAGMTSYSWSGPNAYVSALQSPTVSANATAAMAGTYTLTVTNASGCTSTATAIVVVNALPVATASNNGPVCVGNPLTLAGGPAGMTSYSWSGPNAYVSALQNPTVSANATAAMAGTYTLTVTNANGCINTATTTVTVNALPVATASSNTPVCAGNPLTLAGGPAGMKSYSWSGPNAYVSALQNPTVSANATAAMAGTYTLTVTNASGCTSTATAIVVVNALPVATASNNGPVCVGNPLTLAGGPAGMTSYSWSGPNAYVSALQNPTVSANATAAMAGTYTLTVTNANGCINTVTTTVTVNALPVATASSNTPVCTGNPLTLAGGPAGMTSYSWSGPNAYVSALQNPTVSTNATAAMAGTYTLTVTNANGCTSISNTLIVINGTPIVSIQPNPVVACTLEPLVLSGNPNGGSGSYTSTWSGSGVAYLSSLGTDSTNFSCNVVGTYSLTYTATDGNGCSSSQTLPVVVQQGPIANAGHDTSICYQGVLQLNGTVQFASGSMWNSLGDGSFDNPNSLTAVYTPGSNDLSNGSVILQLIAFGNSPCGNDTSSLKLTIPPQLVASIGTIAPFTIGPNTEIKVKVKTIGHAFANSLNIYLVEPNGNDSVLLSKATLRVDQTYSCGFDPGDIDLTYDRSITTPFNLCNQTQPAIGTYGIDGNWNVLNGLNPAEGGWAIKLVNWYPVSPDDGTLDSAMISFTDTSIFTHKLVTISYLIQSAGIPITDYTEPVFVRVPIGLMTTCSNSCDAKAIVSTVGGTGPFTYLWSTGATTSSVDLCKGNYFVTVTDALGCTSIDSVLVSSPPPIKVDNILFGNGNPINCSGNFTTVNFVASGGSGNLSYTYLGASDTLSIGSAFTNLGIGTYHFSVIDENGCTKDTIITITSSPIFSSGNLLTSNISCNGGNNGFISVHGIGGTPPYTYSLQEGGIGVGVPVVSADSGLFSNLSAGTYLLQVTDSKNCSIDSFANIILTQPNTINLGSVRIQNILCYGETDGNINFGSNITGGTKPYKYSIDNGASWQTDSLFATVPAGTYNLVVEDSNLCLQSYAGNPVIISQPSKISIDTVHLYPVTICASNDNGSLTVIASESTGTLAYSIDSIHWQLADTFPNLAEGTYNIFVRDTSNIGCVVSYFHSTVITGPAPIVITSLVITDSITGQAGAIAVTASGGTGILSYALDYGTFSAVSTWSNLNVGWHYIQVMDANNCTKLDSAFVSSLIVTITNQNITCFGQSTGSITIHTGAPGTYSYSINGGSNFYGTNVFSDLPAGVYLVEVKDANGNINIQSDTLTQPAKGIKIFQVLSTNPLCYNGNSGFLTVFAQGLGTLQYSIDTGAVYQSSNIFNNLTSGEYSILVKDDSTGCTLSKAPITLLNPKHMDVTVVLTPVGGGTKGAIHVISVQNGTPPYSFSIDNGTTFRTDSTFVNLTTGSYTLLTEDNNSCQWDTTLFIISGSTLPVVVIPSNNTCAGDSDGIISFDIMGGTPPYSYTVQGPLNFAGTTSSGTISFANLPSGVYLTSLVDTTGAFANEVTTISSPDSIKFSSVVTGTKCSWYSSSGQASGSIYLTVTGGNGSFTYTWSNGAVKDSLIDLNAGMYYVTVTDINGCTGKDSASVIAQDTVKAIVINTQHGYCRGDNVILDGTGIGQGPLTEQWSVGGLPVGLGGNPTFIAKDSAVFTLTVSDSICSAQDTFHIDVSTVFPLVINAGRDTFVSANNPYFKLQVLNASSGDFTSYSWSPAADIEGSTTSSDATAAIPKATASVTYVLTAITKDGCTETDTSTIIVAGNIFVPSGFSPASTIPQHQIWYIENAEEYPDIEVQVFNRWGELVFESHGYNNSTKCFNGRRNNSGSYLTVGTYYYIINLNDGSNPLTGTVTIVSTP